MSVFFIKERVTMLCNQVFETVGMFLYFLAGDKTSIIQVKLSFNSSPQVNSMKNQQKRKSEKI